MSHMMGTGVAHSHRRKSVAQGRRTFTPRGVFAARMTQEHGGVGATASPPVPTNGCTPPAAHVSDSLRSRLRGHATEPGQPPCHLAPSCAAGGGSGVTATKDGPIGTPARGTSHFTPAMQQQRQQPSPQSGQAGENGSPVRPKKRNRGESEPLENSLALLQLYSRYCEKMEPKTVGPNHQRVQGNGAATTDTTSDNRNIVGIGYSHPRHTVEGRLANELCSQLHTTPAAHTPTAHDSSMKAASATASLCAKNAYDLSEVKRSRKEQINRGEPVPGETRPSPKMEEPVTNHILSWSATGSKPVPESHGTSRLTELRAYVSGNDSAPSPHVSAEHLLTKNANFLPVNIQGNPLPSRLEEIRRHVEKYSAFRDQVAARPLPLKQMDTAQGPMVGWGSETPMPSASCSTFLQNSKRHGVTNGIAPESNPLNGPEQSFTRGYGGETLGPSTFSDPRHKALHVVFDTCSLLEVNDSVLDGVMRHCVVCIPFDVIAELDGINGGKGNRGRGKTESRQLRFSARQIRNWITSAIEKGANVRVQRRCEVEMLYDRKVATKDDSILGFAVFLEQQQQLAVAFVTNDKFLRVKAISELKGKVYDLSEFLRVIVGN